MNLLNFKRTYFILNCDDNNKITSSFSNSDIDTNSWLGRSVADIVIKKEDTEQNIDFYEVLDLKDEIFNVTLFKTQHDAAIYVMKEIDSAEGLYFKANYDTLTKLPNRNLLNDRFNLLLSQSKRANTKLAILFIDLDGFKKINDTHGHNVGDLLLVEISRRLKESIRDSDTVSRWGGDEFIIILNNIDNKSDIDIFVNRMIEDCSKPILIDSSLEVSVSLSIGISIYPDNAGEKNELLELADAAMYKAKSESDLDYFYCK